MGKRSSVYNNFFTEEDWNDVNFNNKQILDEFLFFLKQNKKSEGTIRIYKNNLRIVLIYVLKYCNNNDILSLTKKDFRRLSMFLSSDCGMSNARHNNIMSSLRSMLDFCEDEDDYDYTNVTTKIKGLVKEPVRKISFLTNEEVEMLQENLISKEEYQLALFLTLAYESAARKNEIYQVTKFSFLDANKNNTNTVIGKRNKKFPLLYFNRSKEYAKLWLEKRGEDNIDCVWAIIDMTGNKKPHISTLYNWIIEINDILTELTGYDHELNVHSLRHTALENYNNGTHYVCKETDGLENGIPIEKLKIISHHSDIGTTMGYLKDKSNDELANMFGINIDE